MGHIWFERVEHSWRNDRCVFCGASQSTFDQGETRESHAYAFIHSDNIRARLAALFGDKMQFDVIIGNPPYQLSDGGGGGGASATPIYNLFVKAALALQPRYAIMITLSRWFSGGKGLDTFREDMLTDRRFKKLIDYPQLYDIFPSVKIRGGLSYWLWSRDYSGDCEVTTMVGNEIIGYKMTRRLDAYDVFVRRNEAVVILDKVMNSRIESRLSEKVSARKPFGLTNQRGARSAKKMKDPIFAVQQPAPRLY